MRQDSGEQSSAMDNRFLESRPNVGRPSERIFRSEERRVGKECRSGRAADQSRKKNAMREITQRSASNTATRQLQDQLREVNAHDVLFFFQAEDGIRDIGVTGVQTCALPISRQNAASRHEPE